MSYRNEGIHKDTIRDACPAGIGVRLFMEKEAHYFDCDPDGYCDGEGSALFRCDPDGYCDAEDGRL